MNAIGSLVFLVIGYLFNFYAGFCFLGGPDASILSRSSFMFGIPSLVFSALLVFISTKLTSLRGYVYVPLLVVIVAWLVAINSFQEAGFYVWLFGTAVSSIAVIIYWVLIHFPIRRS